MRPGGAPQLWLWMLWAVAGVAGARGAPAAQSAAEAQVLDGLSGGMSVWQAYKMLYPAEWELADATVVALSEEDAEHVRVRGTGYAAELAGKYRGAVVVATKQVQEILNDGGGENVNERLCAISPAVLVVRENWFWGTYGR
jgi:hypothetical protein